MDVCTYKSAYHVGAYIIRPIEIYNICVQQGCNLKKKKNAEGRV